MTMFKRFATVVAALFVVASVKLDKNGLDVPFLVKDSLIFTLESGVEQKVILVAHGRDVVFMYGESITSDRTFTAGHYVVYDSLTVAKDVVLNIEKGATFYFHDKACPYAQQDIGHIRAEAG